MTDWPTDARACLERVRNYLDNLDAYDCRDPLLYAREDIRMALDGPQPEPNQTKLGRLRLALKQLGDEAGTHTGECDYWHRYYAGKADAYRHALDLVMQLEREGQ